MSNQPLLLSCLQVTKEHIKEGEYKDMENCMIALSLYDAGARKIFVDYDEISFNYMKNGYTFVPDKDVQKRMKQFDNGKGTEPFSINFFNNTASLLKRECKKDMKFTGRTTEKGEFIKAE